MVAVDGARLWRDLMDIAQIGATSRGGSHRLALTDTDKRARDRFAYWCEQTGLTITRDEMGSMFARREGRNPELPPILVGSHLDTQPLGGRFDGVYGVLAALEAMRTLDREGIATDHPIEVVNWTNEEGARFSPATMASGVAAGAWGLEETLARTDKDGVSVGDALQSIGEAGTRPARLSPPHAYLEIHIEQGPVLEAEGLPLGVVEGARGQVWYNLSITGTEAHAGAAAMNLRRDALAAAAEIISMVEKFALIEHPDAVGTVGSIKASPNSPNVVPGKVDLTVEFRAFDHDALRRLDGHFRAGLEDVARRRSVAIEHEVSMRTDPVSFDPSLVDALADAAESAHIPYRRMASGAGHDACRIAAIAPAAMLFIPCVGGLSHNEAEEITPAWAEAGARALTLGILAADRLDFIAFAD